MNDDELEARLRRIDPSASASVHPIDGPRAAALLEQIMNTPVEPGRQSSPAPLKKGRARWVYSALATAVVAGGIAVAVLATRGDDADKAATQVSFALPEASGGPATSMCMRVDAYQPTPGQPAFKGTVLSVADGTVTLQVSTWYSGGDADQVVLNSPGNGRPDPVLEGGVAFDVGGEYLVMALDGHVVGCGVSGPVSAELEALYTQWFPA
jgi:hypothetical protein